MKILLKSLFLLISFAMFFPMSFAQVDYQKKKVVVLKKEIDEQGNVIEKETKLEGKDAEEYIKDLNAEERGVLEMDSPDERIIKINKNVEIDGQTEEQTISYDVTIKEKDGSVKKMQWKGSDESEMPNELREIIEAEQNHDRNHNEKEVDVEVEDENQIQKVKIRIKEKGEVREMEFETEDGEIPEEVKKELEAAGVDTNIILKEEGDRVVESQNKKRSKGQLGVMIQDHEEGVLITDLVAGSSAQKGGLLPGDIITAVDGNKVKNTGALIKAVSDLFAGDEIEVDFIRAEEAMTKRFELKKRTPRTWEEAIRKN